LQSRLHNPGPLLTAPAAKMLRMEPSRDRRVGVEQLVR
jgi:hypothetical protein